MSSQGLLDGAASELFNTYETDYQVAHNEAEQKLSQISDLDGGMCPCSIDRYEPQPPIWLSPLLTPWIRTS